MDMRLRAMLTLRTRVVLSIHPSVSIVTPTPCWRTICSIVLMGGTGRLLRRYRLLRKWSILPRNVDLLRYRSSRLWRRYKCPFPTETSVPPPLMLSFFSLLRLRTSLLWLVVLRSRLYVRDWEHHLCASRESTFMFFTASSFPEEGTSPFVARLHLRFFFFVLVQQLYIEQLLEFHCHPFASDLHDRK